MKCCIKISHKVSKTTFGVPKNASLKKQWETALKMTFKKSYRVCSHHFKENDIINSWNSGKGVTKLTVSCINYLKTIANNPINVLFY